jgi:hypothetical protein
MRPALAGTPVIPFVPPPSKYLRGQSVNVPDVVGLSYSEAVSRLAQAGFRAQVSGQRVSAAPIPAGFVGRQSPSGRTSPGTTVTLYLSNGQFPNATPQLPSLPPIFRPPKRCKPNRPFCRPGGFTLP